MIGQLQILDFRDITSESSQMVRLYATAAFDSQDQHSTHSTEDSVNSKREDSAVSSISYDGAATIRETTDVQVSCPDSHEACDAKCRSNSR